MASTVNSKHSAAAPPVAGAYPIGADTRTAVWDAHAWTGKWHADTAIEPLPPWHHRFLAFLHHAWFWYLAAGSVLTVISGVVTATTGQKYFAFTSLVGLAVFMVGAYLLVDGHERFGQLPHLRALIVWGFVAGAVSLVLAEYTEPVLEPKLGLPFAADLWLSGPIEETSKLLVPFLLLMFGSKAFKDPRAGLLLVLMSGMVFGAVEAMGYIGDPKGWLPLEMSIVRPVSELLHPFLTAFAASVIWLAAWRAGRAVTAIGAGAWMVAMAVHSFHDGIASAGQTGTHDTGLTTVTTAGEAVVGSLFSFAFSLLITILLFLLLRHSARELVPPDAIEHNPPHWRPQIKQWGLPKAEQHKVTKTAKHPAA
ncbi:MAG: PrsW family intramembrane metalloprotease [Actinobacteria bacterium]|nr:PrsW family intramembrane metalloprotease [Actinomycetota bacterium]